ILDRRVQAGFKLPPVGQPCQWIMRRFMLEPRGECALVGDIAQYEHDAEGMAITVANRSCTFVNDDTCSVAPEQHDTFGWRVDLVAGHDTLELIQHAAVA